MRRPLRIARVLGACSILVCLTGCEGLITLDVPGPDAGGSGGGPPRVFVDGGGPSSGDAGECDPGDERPLAVFHGTVEPTVLSMTDGQKMAVVHYRTGGGLCSGTAIAPTWVLSAKHCNPSGSTSGEILFGPDPDHPQYSVSIRRAIVHSGRDLLLLELDAPLTAQAPTLTPIPYYTGTIDASWVGRVVECGGYGQQEDGTLGERRFTAEPISDRSGTYITVNGEGRHGLCGGDSGGSILWQDPSNVIYVLGALTGGDPSCVGEDNYTAVDADWVRMNVGEPADPCMGETATGRCDGNTARWCEGGMLHSEACVAPRTCGSSAVGFRCVDASMPSPCGEVTAVGRCTADGAAEWCEAGQLRRAECGRCGMLCEPVPARGGAYCVPNAPP
ncbi:MAG: trypsin-like serine protease [Sandaracinaceae bacterium]